MITYEVRLEHDPEDGNWNVTVPELPGVFTFGRNIEKAKAYAREAIACWLDVDEDSFEIKPTIVVSDEQRELIKQLKEATLRAQESQDARLESMRTAAKQLAAQMTERDAAAVMGISHQRVHQLVSS